MRLKFSKLLLFSLLLTLGYVFSSPVLAVSSSSINVDVAPPNPAPGDSVTITLSSYAANLDSVLITWVVNGKNVASGIGKKSFSTTAGASGSRVQVMAKIALPDGEIDKNITIAPSVMVILWQATDSYVPPFYKGKALLPSESDVKIVALPEIKTAGGIANPKNMTYTWQKNYNNVADASGYGKNFYTFTGDYLDSTNNVDVVAATLDQQYSSEANINVTTSTPQISLYKQDPVLGILWEQALPDTYKIPGSETVIAVPYFISPKELWLPELTFSWFINDIAVDISSGYNKEILPLKVQAGTSGISKLRVQVDDTTKLSETATKEINVQF